MSDLTPWHAIEIPEALARQASTRDGLSSTEARQRLARHGPNALPPPPRRGLWRRLAGQFHNVLIYVLLAAAGVTAVLGHGLDTAVIVGVVLINALVGFIQEGRAERSLDAVRELLSPRAAVLRDGRRISLDAAQLVPGDVVWLQSGDRVPADLRLLGGRELAIDEALLTGESVPVSKRGEPITAEAPITDRFNMAWSGTFVTRGQGTGLVVATGADTQLGQVSQLLAGVETLATPLLRQMTDFGRLLTGVILVVALLTFLVGTLIRDYAAADMFMAAVGLAVAAIPEGLPAIMTITLAIGVQRMARRHAIIRRLPAVEALGSVTVICTDKTGTLTRNEMTVQRVLLDDADFAVSGVGYDPHGGFSVDGAEVDIHAYPAAMELFRAGALCNDAGIHLHEGHWQVEGDPTEIALTVLAVKAGVDPEHTRERFPRVDLIPFESEHRFMATLHHDHEHHAFAYVKGAPEVVLPRCTQFWGRDQVPDGTAWRHRIERVAGAGQRLLALARKPLAAGCTELDFDDVQSGLELIGMVGIMDPPREEAIRAVAQCVSAGIRVKMITGDHAITAAAVGARLGIGRGKPVLTGSDLDALDDAALRHAVADTDVFARVDPAHKLRLVQALQANGEVAAMTGDGVNDAPALKRADVGVAMGLKGTEAAKEAALMVLADDNFASIASAVEEGRTVYDNIRKSILFILPTSFGEAFTLIAAIATGSELPVTPVQILWINMLTAVTLGMALAFEPPEKGVMQRPPRRPQAPLLSRFMFWRILFVATLMVLATFLPFLAMMRAGAAVETARTLAVNILVVLEVAYLFNSRRLISSVLDRAGLFGSRAVWVSVAVVVFFQYLFTYAEPFHRLFQTRDLVASAWLPIGLAGVTLFLVVEAEKALIRARALH